MSSLVQRIQESFRYEPETGDLYWKPDRPRHHFTTEKEYGKFLTYRAGQKVNTTINHYGYVVVGIGKTVVPVHRVAFVLMTGKFPEGVTDHIDRNRTNNRWANLRAVSLAINARNQSMNSRNSTGIAGVRWSRRDKKWSSHVQHEDRQIYLGTFLTKEEAAQARVAWIQAHPELGYAPDHGQPKP